MYKVSVLMPVYNVKEEYLKESIESILNQTFSDFELIILDDGSTNDIETVVKSYNDDRIAFYKNEENLGVSKTRNKLLDLAKGEYVAFQDSDDISYPARLEKEVKFLDENPEISGVSSWLETFPNNKFIPMPKNIKAIDFLGGCLFSQPASMLRIEDFRKNNFYYNADLTTSEDYDLWARAVKVLNFANLQEPLIKYRKNPNSLYHRSNKKAVEIDKNIKNELLQDLVGSEKLQKDVLETVTNYYQKKT